MGTLIGSKNSILVKESILSVLKTSNSGSMQEPSKLIMVKNAAKALRDECRRTLSETTAFSKIEITHSLVHDYNRLASQFNSLNLAGFQFPDISVGDSIDITINKIVAGCSQIISIVEGALTDISRKINELEIEIDKYKHYQALVKSYLETPEFKIEMDLLEKLPKNIQKYLVEASSCYGHGEYIACCSMCGNVLEGLINAESKKRNISETKLLDRSSELLKRLSGEGKKVEKVHESLIEVVKFYRDHASHPTEETSTRERASLFINTLLILCKEIFL